MSKKVATHEAIIKRRGRSEGRIVKNIAQLMDDAGTFHLFDTFAASLLAKSIVRLDELPNLGLEVDREIEIELKIMNSINRYLTTLGLSKPSQIKIQSILKGRGRPSKTPTYDDDDDNNDGNSWEKLIDE
jgi:hypothetical protein